MEDLTIMNKSEFMKEFAATANMSVAEATKAYAAFVETITESLKKGEKIQLTGFANVEIKDKPEREGINPSTKAKIIIKASKAPVVKFSKTYKETFNA